MATQNESINELSEAIFAIREKEGAAFNADYALRQLAATVAFRNVQKLSSMPASTNVALLSKLGCAGPAPESVGKAEVAFEKAMNEATVFTDVLADACLIFARRHNVSYGPRFVRPGLFDSWGDQAISHLDPACNLMGIASHEHAAGSGILSMLSALNRRDGNVSLKKTSIFLGNEDPLELLLGIMQVGSWLLRQPRLFKFADFSLITNHPAACTTVFSVGKHPSLVEAA